MSSDVKTLIFVAAIIAIVLYKRGYIRVPAFLAQRSSPNVSGPSQPATAPPLSNTTFGEASPSEAYILERLDSHTLGVYFALAARREAEANLAHNVARKAGTDIETMFTAPFSPPAPAGQ